MRCLYMWHVSKATSSIILLNSTLDASLAMFCAIFCARSSELCCSWILSVVCTDYTISSSNRLSNTPSVPRLTMSPSVTSTLCVVVSWRTIPPDLFFLRVVCSGRSVVVIDMNNWSRIVAPSIERAPIKEWIRSAKVIGQLKVSALPYLGLW